MDPVFTMTSAPPPALIPSTDALVTESAVDSPTRLIWPLAAPMLVAAATTMSPSFSIMSLSSPLKMPVEEVSAVIAARCRATPMFKVRLVAVALALDVTLILPVDALVMVFLPLPASTPVARVVRSVPALPAETPVSSITVLLTSASDRAVTSTPPWLITESAPAAEENPVARAWTVPAASAKAAPPPWTT